MSEDIISNRFTGQDIKFIRTAADTKGKFLEMETIYKSVSKEPVPHYHPCQDEDFEVLEGEVSVRIDGQVKVLEKGETLHIPANKTHSMWNNSKGKTVISWKISPAIYIQEIPSPVLKLPQMSKKIILLAVLAYSVFAVGCKSKIKSAQVDGITTAAPEDVGLSSERLTAMETELAKGTYNVHSILILRHNKLAYEKYFPGKDEMFATPLGVVNHSRDSLHDCRSITKSVVSACIGVAIVQQKIKDVNDRVLSYFPEYSKYDTGAKHDLTIKHLLTMSDGLEWNERIPYSDPKNSEIQMIMNPDVVDFVLSRSIVTKPGTTWNYSGGTTQLLAKILERVSGLKVDSFANKYIFIPIGINKFSWYRREDGTPWAPSGLRLRPIDMAKFGMLYINSGKHNGQQVIPEAWVKESITPQVKRQSGSQGYGYQFWCGRDSILGKDVKIALGIGYGGQRVYLLPSLDLVIIVTAGNYDEKSDLSDAVVEKFIRPAIKE